MDEYDVIIIGGGAGAFAAAIKANELNSRTLMVNAGLPLGGTCVNVGCVPSKTLLYAGEFLHSATQHGIEGIELEVKNFDFQKTVQHELNLVEQLRKEKYETVLANLKNVTLIEGKASFISDTQIQVNGQTYSAKKFVIATGSTATAPDIEGLQEAGYITHVEALKLKVQPKKLVVLGAGAVGLEFAQMYSRFGTKVTILQRSGSIFKQAEPELTERLQELLEKEGITITTNTKLKKVIKEDSKKVVIYETSEGEQRVEADEILVASGKTSNTKDLMLENAGVAVNEKQAITVTNYYQTAKPHIYAVGDVAALPLRLETTAGKEGTLAAENAITGTQKTIDYATVPYTIFTDPQLASVGLTEDEQMEKLKVCACRTVSFSQVPKGLITNRTEGLIKMAIHPETHQVMGVHILAPNASDLIAEAMVLVQQKMTIEDVLDTLPVFPSMSEAIKIVAMSFTKDVSKLSCCV